MTPDEVRMLDNRYALAFIRGARPVKDLKYDLMKHPNIRWTSDGGFAEYEHGSAADARLSLWLVRLDPNEQYADASLNAETAGYVLMSEEDIEKEYEKKENADNENS